MLSKDYFYSSLCNKYGAVARFRELLSQMQCILKACHFELFVTVNTDVLGKVIIDYFEDIDRLKEFEEIDRVCVSKIYAHEVYWIMRRKPIQITVPHCPDERCLYINELVCAALIVSKMFAEKGIVPPTENVQMMTFFNLLYYNLKYRTFTQHSLELAIESFFLGTTISVK